MLFESPPHPATALEQTISQAHRMPETSCVNTLIDYLNLQESDVTTIQQHAENLIIGARKAKQGQGGIDAFMVKYDLSSEEGITLMCLAEALLRIPDKITADKLIQDKICKADWKSHLKQSDSLFVNASTWGLMLTGKLIEPSKKTDRFLSNTFKKLLNRSSEGTIRAAIRQAMKILGKQFVLGETIDEALKRAKKQETRGYRYSYDMLGEAAKTDLDAQYYFDSYSNAIHAIGQGNQDKNIVNSAGISVKLSALHARYESTHPETVFAELYPRILKLAELTKQYDIGLTIDAEEVDRLEISLKIIEKLALEKSLSGWQGLGLALQTYSKRAFFVLDWLLDLAKRSKRRFMVRLVKGAYWDTEIKLSQEFGLSDYPVFTRKLYTDVSYLACVKKVLANTDLIFPQFATHNAYTLASILHLAQDYRDYEFQCLHGMGDALYDQVVEADSPIHQPCRIYAPVGTHEHLLAYLVRRLLENGANSSFVNRLVNATVPVSALTEDPVMKAKALKAQSHPNIPHPDDIYGTARKNAKGIDIHNEAVLAQLKQDMDATLGDWQAYPLIAGQRKPKRTAEPIHNPANHQEIVGHVINGTENEVEKAISKAQAAFHNWDQTPAENRAQCLEKMADLLERNMAHLMTIAIKEAGKSLPNAISEVREAVDFCRYYAQQARKDFSEPTTLPGPTGELNQWSLHGRGVMVCISPWNFPLAIFLGEVTAALAAGNTVIAKPAEQTALIAFAATKLLYEAGIPKDVVQLLPGTGETVGAKLVADERIAGVIFTGSTETAKAIQRSLANKPGPIVPFVAETGGQNALIVDSSALPEQVTTDVVASAFDSAGQRCSALRVLFVQEDIADNLIKMIQGAMEQLTIGDPALLKTDIGPVIDQEAQSMLLNHIDNMKDKAKLIYQVPLNDHTQNGTFVPPTAFELTNLKVLEREVFGPVLHIVRFKAKDLDKVVQQINDTGYGLTCGVHSRIDNTINFIQQNIRVGNLYVNRNQIGAVVGVQPFGGEGLSGTGPKAGGPLYLQKLATERVVSVDTTAAGGNASLMSIEE